MFCIKKENKLFLKKILYIFNESSLKIIAFFTRFLRTGVIKILRSGGSLPEVCWGVGGLGFQPGVGGGRILPWCGGMSYGIIWGRPFMEIFFFSTIKFELKCGEIRKLLLFLFAQFFVNVTQNSSLLQMSLPMPLSPSRASSSLSTVNERTHIEKTKIISDRGECARVVGDLFAAGQPVFLMCKALC